VSPPIPFLKAKIPCPLTGNMWFNQKQKTIAGFTDKLEFTLLRRQSMKIKWLVPLFIIALTVTIVSIISWFAFPQWKTAEGGFFALLSVVIVSAVPVIKEVISMIKEWSSIKSEEQTKDKLGNERTFLKNGERANGYGEIKPVLRRFITEALGEQELREVITDYFENVKSNISLKSSMREATDELLNYAINQGKVEYLIEIISKYNSYQYNKYKKELAAFIPVSDDKDK
jgi:hypothetical protein